jgi:hypothetical protein
MDLTLQQRVTGLEHLMEPLPARIGTLEDKVHKLDTWAGPGQNKGLSDNIIGFRSETNGHFAEVKKKLKELGVVQDQHTGYLQRHARMIDDLMLMSGRMRDTLLDVQVEVADFKTEVAAEIGTLKGDLAEFKVEVKGALAEILDRLPPKKA